MRTARLLEKGYSQSEVARRVGAHRQSVSQWAGELREKGRAGLKKAGRAGRKPRLRAEDLRKIERGLKRGPETLGYATIAKDVPEPSSPFLRCDLTSISLRSSSRPHATEAKKNITSMTTKAMSSSGIRWPPSAISCNDTHTLSALERGPAINCPKC